MQFGDGFGVLQVPWSGCSRLTPAFVPQDLPQSPINWCCLVAKGSHSHVRLLHLPSYSVYFPSLEGSWDREGTLPCAAALPPSLAPTVQ